MTREKRFVIAVHYNNHPGEHPISVYLSHHKMELHQAHGKSLKRLMNQAVSKIVDELEPPQGTDLAKRAVNEYFESTKKKV